MSISSRERVLLVLMAVVVVVGGARVLQQLSSGGELGLSLGRSRGPVAEGLDTEVVELKMDALDRRSFELEVGRDPFRFAPQRQERPPRPPLPPLSPRQGPAVVEPQPGGPQPPVLRLNYLGSFGRPDRKLAVFSDGETIYNAMEGEVLDGKFVVQEIGFESVDVAFVGFPDVPARRLAAGR